MSDLRTLPNSDNQSPISGRTLADVGQIRPNLVRSWPAAVESSPALADASQLETIFCQIWAGNGHVWPTSSDFVPDRPCQNCPTWPDLSHFSADLHQIRQTSWPSRFGQRLWPHYSRRVANAGQCRALKSSVGHVSRKEVARGRHMGDTRAVPDRNDDKHGMANLTRIVKIAVMGARRAEMAWSVIASYAAHCLCPIGGQSSFWISAAKPPKVVVKTGVEGQMVFYAATLDHPP